MKKPFRWSELTLSCAALGLIIGVGLWGFTLFDHKPRFDRLKREGATTGATVVQKLERERSCGQSRRRNNRSCTEQILMLRSLEPSVGSAELVVTKTRFSKAQQQDNLEIVYLPENPRKVWEAQTVKHWSVWPGLLGGTVSLGIGAGLSRLGLSQRAAERRPQP